MKIIVTNTALLNTGDAAIMLGTCAILRQALGETLEIAVRDQQPEIAGECYDEFEPGPVLYDRIVAWKGERGAKRGILQLLAAALLWRAGLRFVARRMLPPALAEDLAAFAAADLVVSAGGTYLVPHYRISPKLLDLLVTRCLGRPYVLFTQSLGPFPEHGPRRLLRRVLRGAHLVMVRDEPSYWHLVELGVDPGRIVECADAAFALPIPARRAAARGAVPQVAISVRDWPHFVADANRGMTHYLDAMAALVEDLVERHGAKVTFLSTCQGVAEYWTDDARTADAVVERLPTAVREHVQVNREFHRPEALTAHLGAFDLVVATRMHVAILALTASTPVLPIAYEFKTKELFAKLGLGEFVEDMEHVSAARLQRNAETLLAARDGLRTAADAQAEALRHAAHAAVLPLKDALKGAA